MVMVLAVLLACAPTPAAPTLRAMSPSRGWTGEATPVELTGENLYPNVVVDLSGDDGRFDESFRAWVETEPPTEIDALELVDFQTLTGTVPAGIPPGTYDVLLETPSGATATLQYGFTVTETRADHLALTAATVAHQAGDPATVTVSLLDPDGHEVRESMEVEVWVESNLEESGAAVANSTLLDAAALSDRVGLRGWLQPEGKATFDVDTTREEELYVYAEPVTDTTVDQAATLQLSFTVGDLANIDLSLPEVGFSATAGEEFAIGIALTDAAGNPSTDAQTVTVVLTSECGGSAVKFQKVEDGVGEVLLSLTEACDSYSVEARVADVVGTLGPFAVNPGPLAGYKVGATPTTLVAGQTDVVLTINAVDDFGNGVAGGVQPYTVVASSGELGEGYTGCDPLNGGYGECVLHPTVAGNAETWTVTDTVSFSGTSGPVIVRADDAVEVRVEPQTGKVEAGEAFDVVVGLYDQYGNVVEYSPGDANSVAFADDTGTISCGWAGKQGDDQVFECVVTAATGATAITARVGPSWIEGTAASSVEVVNAALASIEVSPPTTDQVAGVPFQIRIEGFDAYGNAFVHQADPVLYLSDSTGSLSPSSVVFEPDGGVWVDAEITTADPAVVVTARQDSLTGSGAPFTVLAAEPVSFAVRTDPWVEVDAPLQVEVRALDEFGNTADAYAGSVDVAGANSCDLVTLSEFDAGVGSTTVTCPSAYLGETLLALDDGGLTGTSDDFDVVSLDCASPPTADLALDGGPEPVLCWLGAELHMEADASGSAPGDAPIAMYQLNDEAGTQFRSPTPSATFSFDAAGAHRIELLVVDDEGCAARTSDVVWIADGEDEPAGPVDVSVSASTVTTGDPALTVSVAARDCTGDVAAGQSLLVRADLGDVSGTATGSGLSITLDSHGEGSFDWFFAGPYAADATVWAGTSSGGAVGSAQVSVNGDSSHPHVVSVLPSGRTLSTWSTITVTFDEEIRSPVPSSGVILVGPEGTIAVTTSVSNNVVTVTPASPIDGSTGTYTLTLSPDIRDAAGANRLDGQWIGDRSSYTVRIGDVPLPTLQVSSCDADLRTFTPDGDDGTDAEADAVVFSPVANAAATWWWLEVVDSLGDRVRSDRAPGTDATFDWDGRGDDGRVVSAGTYTTRVYALDDDGNVTDACTHRITVDQRLEIP